MPKVGSKKFPYTPAGMKAAKAESKKMKKAPSKKAPSKKAATKKTVKSSGMPMDMPMGMMDRYR